MFKSFCVLLVCLGCGLVQASFTEDYVDLGDIFTEYTDYMFTYRDCAPNEILECKYPCPPEQTCRDRGEQVKCTEEEKPCEVKCVCQPGFFKNTENGVCVTEKQCDKCLGPNEHYACGSPCDNICHTLHLHNQTSCPGYDYSDCQPSCYCDDGYARNASGVCIPINECPIPKCGRNEIFTECKKSCLNETCSSIMDPSTCDSEEQCDSQGCVCKDGFFRVEENAPCIPLCECPQMNDSQECKSTRRKYTYYLSKVLDSLFQNLNFTAK